MRIDTETWRHILLSMQSSIMPPGYSIARARERLKADLEAKRSAEMANASSADRLRIKKEIQAQVEQEILKRYPEARHGWLAWFTR